MIELAGNLKNGVPIATPVFDGAHEKDIVQKENEFRKNGGRFLVPIPTPKIIGV